MNPYITIFQITLPSYGLCIAAGVIAVTLTACLFLKRHDKSIDDFLAFEGYVLLGAFLGAKLLYLWVAREQIDWGLFRSSLYYFNQVMAGGFVFYGGLIGGMLFLLVPWRLHHIDVAYYLRHLSFIVPLGHAFGRMGCFFAGCCYGIPYTGPFHVVFPEEAYGISGISLFPVQLLEAILLVILSAIVFYLSNGTKNQRDGFLVYLLGYSVLRFFLEFLRYDFAERGHFLVLSTSQWISLMLIVIICASFPLRKMGFCHTSVKNQP